jgi:L-ascorbate metabolism protein UlaG (beta-lactamase superfamily)
MKIKYFGCSAFVITSGAGIRIITDPYEAGPDWPYREITESADIVTVSHDHFDHNNVAAVRGSPVVVRRAGRSMAKGMEIKGIASYHDEAQGRMRGNNTIFCFEVDEIRVCHLGDLGHLLDDRQVKEIGSVDILLIPVGGFFTIDAKAATQVGNQLKPKIIVPMHYKWGEGVSSLAGVDEFLRGKANVNRLDASEVEFKRGELPATSQIMVLKPAL